MTSTTSDQTLEHADAPVARTHPFFWSVRRELWEHPSIWIAPAITAGVVLLGILVGALNIGHHNVHLAGNVIINGRAVSADQTKVVEQLPFEVPAAIIMVASFVVGFFYCLGALYAERRERTILFWKSLPVSDLTTVAAKATVPLVVLPLVTFVVIAITQLIVLGASLVVLPLDGLPATLLVQEFPLLETWANLFVMLACLSLWNAPIWGWNFLISGWARRVTFLWSVGPPLGLAVFEMLAFRTHYVHDLIDYRLVGGIGELAGGTVGNRGQMTINGAHLDLAHFFTLPGLWFGLLAAAALFAAAVWQRRYRSPF
jgi:ABC-2 type transport system permease protein